MYKISIIIPVYNEEKFLNGCLDSIVNQSMDLNEIQVIIVNDGSNDGSAGIIDKYVQNYSSFMCITRDVPSGGCAEPRNVAMDFVDAKYILFVDADDRIDKDYCNVLYNQIEFEKSNCVISNYLVLLNDDTSYKMPDKLNIEYFNPLNVPYNPIPFTSWGKIFNAEFLKNYNLLFTNQLWEDILFFAYFCYYDNHEISFITNYQGYFYNKMQWGNTLSSSSEAKTIDKILGRVDVLKELLIFSNNNGDVFKILCNYLLRWNFRKLFIYSLNKEDNISYVDALNKLMNEFSLNINSPFHYLLINKLVKNKKYFLINILRSFKFKFLIAILDNIT